MTALTFNFNPHAKARSSDPDTSKTAARMAEDVARGHHQKIRDFLDGVYPRSASYEDISAATGIERHAVGRRMNEAVLTLGYAVVSGKTLLSTGRPGQMWRARP